MSLSRRELLAGATALGMGSSSLLKAASISTNTGTRKKLRFVFMTDLHIQPDLGAAEGVKLAVQKILALRPRPDFVICGGDHVMDALMVTRDRADSLFALFTEAMKPLDMPVVSVIGNHDVFGWGVRGNREDPMYGKGLISERVLQAPTYRSFYRAGYHFVLLDSIQPSKTKSWRGYIDDDQLNWLVNDLEAAGTTPTIIVSPMPILTAYTQYAEGSLRRPSDWIQTANGRELQRIISKHNVKAVLQGHTHVLESIHYMHTRYITAGAICGEWWKGPRFGVHPEGFLVCDMNDEEFTTKYLPYGWKARV